MVVQGRGYPLTSDGNGKIEQDIPPTAQDGFLAITADQTPFQNVQIPLKIGTSILWTKCPVRLRG